MHDWPAPSVPPGAPVKIPEQVLLLSPISLNGAMGLALKLTVAASGLVIGGGGGRSPWGEEGRGGGGRVLSAGGAAGARGRRGGRGGAAPHTRGALAAHA